MAIITMGGLSGGGARALGPLVAEKISADYVDRLILADIARHVGATVEALHQREASDSLVSFNGFWNGPL